MREVAGDGRKAPGAAPQHVRPFGEADGIAHAAERGEVEAVDLAAWRVRVEDQGAVGEGQVLDAVEAVGAVWRDDRALNAVLSLPDADRGLVPEEVGDQRVRARTAEHRVRAGARHHDVVAAGHRDVVVAGARVDDVAGFEAEDGVPRLVAGADQRAVRPLRPMDRCRRLSRRRAVEVLRGVDVERPEVVVIAFVRVGHDGVLVGVARGVQDQAVGEGVLEADSVADLVQGRPKALGAGLQRGVRVVAAVEDDVEAVGVGVRRQGIGEDVGHAIGADVVVQALEVEADAVEVEARRVRHLHEG